MTVLSIKELSGILEKYSAALAESMGREEAARASIGMSDAADSYYGPHADELVALFQAQAEAFDPKNRPL